MPDWLPTVVEWTAAALGFACVVLTVRQNMWCWPTGLLQVLLYIYVFLSARLYSDMILHVIYVVLQVYGWWAWLHGGKDKGRLQTSWLSGRVRAAWALVIFAGTFTWGFLMARFTDAALPYWDAATTVLSIVAQYLLAHKKIESWVLWIVVDILCVGIYFVKDLHTTMVLYAVFLVLAVMGLKKWTQSTQKQLAAAPA